MLHGSSFDERSQNVDAHPPISQHPVATSYYPSSFQYLELSQKNYIGMNRFLRAVSTSSTDGAKNNATTDPMPTGLYVYEKLLHFKSVLFSSYRIVRDPHEI